MLKASLMRLWDDLRQDLRYAARTLSRSPGFALAAMLTLALGIGANTAIFSTIDEALLRPLPLPAADRLADIYTYNKATRAYVSSSYPDYEDFAQRSRSFQQISAYVRMPFRVTIGDQTERVPTEAVTANYFSMLELPAWRGRAFQAEDGTPGAPPVAMIGEDFWRRHFQSDPAAIGRILLIEDHAFTIAGIVPRRYRGVNLNWGLPPQIWIPLQPLVTLVPPFQALDVFHQRRIPWLVLIGRLRPGVTVERAQAELQAIAGAVAQAEPATNRDLTAAVFEASHSKFWPAYRASVTASLVVFAVAAGLVLLLACANVSNLLLERALGRRREFAIRLAIGAGRTRLLRQMLTESLLLVLPGIALALALTSALQKVLLHFPNALGLPLALDLTVESRALLFCLALSLAASVLFGLAPAVQATRADVLPSLKESGNTLSGRGHGWYGQALVVVQVAFSMILLVGGGLFGRSLLKAYSTDLGFRSQDLLIAEFSLPILRAPERAQFLGLQQALVQRLAGAPGVQSATLASAEPISPVHVTATVQATTGAGPLTVDRDLVGPDFLATMGIPLLRGRGFTARDDARAPRVAIVNQTLAARLAPASDLLGRTILLQEGSGKTAPLQVVGVARDAKYRSVWEDRQPYLYLPAAQAGLPANYLLLRTRIPPANVIPEIRRQWQGLSPRMPFEQIRTADEQVDFSLGPERMAAAILAAFGVLAIALASVGLYSVMAYSVRQRTREIGIRMAMGARPQLVVRQVLGNSMRPVAAGVVLGAAAGAALMRLASSLIKDVSPYDSATFLVVALLLATVALAASLAPARRAAGIDPLKALRCD